MRRRNRKPKALLQVPRCQRNGLKTSKPLILFLVLCFLFEPHLLVGSEALFLPEHVRFHGSVFVQENRAGGWNAVTVQDSSSEISTEFLSRTLALTREDFQAGQFGLHSHDEEDPAGLHPVPGPSGSPLSLLDSLGSVPLALGLGAAVSVPLTIQRLALQSVPVEVSASSFVPL